MHRASLLALLTRYAEANAEERAVARRFAALFEARPDCFERSCLPGHATASAFIVSADRSAFLLTHHRKLGKWLQLGVPLDIDIHAIPARAGEPAHDHYDVRFLLQAGADQELVMSHESTGLAWFPMADAREIEGRESLGRLWRKARSWLAMT